MVSEFARNHWSPERALLAQTRNHVDVVRRLEVAMHHTGGGAVHVPGNSPPLQDIDQRRQGDGEIVVPVHTTVSW